MKCPSILAALTAATLLCGSSASGNANTVTVFDAFESFLPGGVPLSGTVTIDVTAGSITAADLVVPGFSDFTSVDQSFPGPLFWNVIISNVDGNAFVAGIFTNFFPASLVGYAGGGGGAGDICDTALCSNLLLAGGWTLTAEATPLPAALPLFVSGLGALGLFGWRNKRKAARA